MCSFHETGEFRGRKKGDVARSPPPNDNGFLLVHYPIENAGQILTEAGVRRFTWHEAPNEYCTVFLYGRENKVFGQPNLPPPYSIEIDPKSYQPSGSRPAIPSRITGLRVRGSSNATRRRYTPAFKSGTLISSSTT